LYVLIRNFVTRGFKWLLYCRIVVCDHIWLPLCHNGNTSNLRVGRTGNTAVSNSRALVSVVEIAKSILTFKEILNNRTEETALSTNARQAAS
jgi:hypothetical protein